jgi:nicotinamide-nucleotide amidase
MKAEIIAVGSEMLTPDNLDTNSLFITAELNEAGFQVHFKTVVGDREKDIAEVLGTAIRRSTAVIVTGGLGPTEDDLTRSAVASVLRRPLHTDPFLVEMLRNRFQSRGWNMPAINLRQAEVIDGAEVLENPNGSAPGMWIEVGKAVVVLLPGPPRELKPMLESQVIPRMRRIAGGRRLVSRTMHIAGMTESEVDSRAAPIYGRYPNIETTILAGTGLISLRLLRWLEPGERAGDLEELANSLEACLGEALFSNRGESIEEVVGRMLLQSGQSLAVAESCTSGLLAGRITRVPGSSAYFLGGALCYSDEVKMSLCGVPREVLAAHGAVSSQVAEALAQGIRSRLGASVGLSVTGIAGPGGGSEEKPVGLVYMGLADETRLVHVRRMFAGDRDGVRDRSAFFALASLRTFLRR